MAIDWSILRSPGPVDIAGNFARGFEIGSKIVDQVHEKNALAAYAAHPGDPAARAALYRVNPELAARLEKRDEDRSDYQREGEARGALADWMTGPSGLPSPRGLTGVQPNALTGAMPQDPSASPMPDAAPPSQPAEQAPNGDITVTGQPKPQAQPDNGLIRQPPMSDSWKRYVEADPAGAMKTLLTRADLGKTQALALAGQMDFLGRLAAGVHDQASYERAKQVGQAQGFDTSHLPAEYSPDVVSNMQAQAMSAKDHLKQQHDFTDDEIDNAETERHHQAEESNTQRGQDMADTRGRRGQDIASTDRQRGQDLSHEDRQRGQDLSSSDRKRAQDMRGHGGRSGGNTLIIVNPKTGQKMKLVDGKWVPA